MPRPYSLSVGGRRFSVRWRFVGLGPGPVEGGAKVAVFGFEALQPGGLVGATKLVLGLLGKIEVIEGVAAVGRGHLAAFGEALQGIFAYSFEHAEAWLASGWGF